MGKVESLENCTVVIDDVTYIYSRTDDKIYYKKYSERDRPDILYVLYEGVSYYEEFSGFVTYLNTEAELRDFIDKILAE